MAKLAVVALCLVAMASVASARPRFLAVPLEDLDFINAVGPDGEPVLVPQFKHRLVRRAAPATAEEPETAADNSYGKPSYGGHHDNKGNDYVDYGAYTGGNGAFGWYTDHPVGVQGKY